MLRGNGSGESSFAPQSTPLNEEPLSSARGGLGSMLLLSWLLTSSSADRNMRRLFSAAVHREGIRSMVCELRFSSHISRLGDDVGQRSIAV